MKKNNFWKNIGFVLFCGLFSNAGLAVNGLYFAEQSKYPEVAIFVRADEGSYTLGLIYRPTLCSGTMIAPGKVLTSESCVTGRYVGPTQSFRRVFTEVYVQLGSKAFPFGVVAMSRQNFPDMTRIIVDEKDWVRASKIETYSDFANLAPELKTAHNVAVLTLPIDTTPYKPVRAVETRCPNVGDKIRLAGYGYMGMDQNRDGLVDSNHVWRSLPRTNNSGYLRSGTNYIDGFFSSLIWMNFSGVARPATTTDLSPADDVSVALGDEGGPIIDQAGRVNGVILPNFRANETDSDLYIEGFAQSLCADRIPEFLKQAAGI
jgi:hypothetical protein